MKARNYRETYKNTREMLIKDMQDALEKLPENSLDLSQTSKTCNIQAIDDQETIVAMGVTMDFKDRITIHGGVYDADSRYHIDELWFETLLDLYECFEEALNDDPQPFIEE